MIRYGKSNAEYVRLKSVIYDPEQNRRWAELAEKVSGKYREQPRREACVACAVERDDAADDRRAAAGVRSPEALVGDPPVDLDRTLNTVRTPRDLDTTALN